jgi:hypothetical protein
MQLDLSAQDTAFGIDLVGSHHGALLYGYARPDLHRSYDAYLDWIRRMGAVEDKEQRKKAE